MEIEKLKLKLLEKVINQGDEHCKKPDIPSSGYVSNPIYKNLLTFHANNTKIGDKLTVKDLLR